MYLCIYAEMNTWLLDESVREYVSCMADDDGSEQDKIASIHEYLTAMFEDEDIPISAVSDYVRSRAQPSFAKPCPTAVALSALKQENTVIVQERNTQTDKAMVKDLLKRYDDGEATFADDCEIHGLGPNENRLRIVREREESRANAKKEQEQANIARIEQKLKTQGEQIRDKTTRRKK